MGDLPRPLILEILSRLGNTADLARCRVASKTLNILAADVRSINIQCSSERYNKSRSPATESQITPFKHIIRHLVLNTRRVESVSIGVEKPLRAAIYDDTEEDDDLHLTDVSFVKEWLPSVCGSLVSISISDFWIQSCWRRSGFLPLISSCCHNLLRLEVKSAWLSVEGLNPMPKLTNLTLEFIRLDDEDLKKVNECFPSLEALNLLEVGGLEEPRIELLHLKSCQWTVSNFPNSVTIIAPNLVKLKLKCVKPRELVIKAPLLSDFHLSLEKASDFKVEEFYDLKTLRLESTHLYNLLCTFPFGKTIKNLTLDSQNREMAKLSLGALFEVFPNLSSLSLGHGAWAELEKWHSPGSLDFVGQMKGLRRITAYLVVRDTEITLSCISFVLEKCIDLSDMALFIHHHVDSHDYTTLISRCVAHHSRVRWRWGMWKEGMKDAWAYEGI